MSVPDSSPAARRMALIARSERLRGELGAEFQALGTRFQLADRIFRIARSGLAQAVVAGAAALLLFGRPRRLLRTATRLFMLWPVLKRFWPDFAALWRSVARD